VKKYAVRGLIQSWLESTPADAFPRETAEKLLERLGANATNNKKEKKKKKKMATTLNNLMEAFAGESQANRKYLAYSKQAEKEGKKAAQKSFKFAMKAEEVHARLYQEALDSLDDSEEVFYYLCPVCGNTREMLKGTGRSGRRQCRGRTSVA